MLSRSLMRYIYCVYIVLRRLCAHHHSLRLRVLLEIATPRTTNLMLECAGFDPHLSLWVKGHLTSMAASPQLHFLFAPARSMGIDLLDNHICVFRVYQYRADRIRVRIRASQKPKESFA